MDTSVAVKEQSLSEAVQLPDRRAISSEAHAEIKTLWGKFIIKATESDAARQAFIAFINVVKTQMGLPENENWLIDENASYFELQAPIANVPAQSAGGEGEDSSLEVPSAHS